MFASIQVNGWKLEPFSTNPMLGPSHETLVMLGAKESTLIVQEREVWRIFSANVLHAGLIHFFLNMLALWFIGKAIEECHGSFRTMLLFVVPGIGGTILSAIFLPNMISVGASGGIFGLIGACLADIFMNWGLLFNKVVNGENDHGTMVGNGESIPCESCRAISCVEFPPWADENNKWWYCDDCYLVAADARKNVNASTASTDLFDQVTVTCPYGDVFTLDIDDRSKEWMENQLPNWCSDSGVLCIFTLPARTNVTTAVVPWSLVPIISNRNKLKNKYRVRSIDHIIT
eukprot:scaffold2392_cov287-Chaetoceros_neogracile.AAC.2